MCFLNQWVAKCCIFPGRPGVATGFPLFAPFFTLQRIEVSKSVTLNLHFFQAHLHFMCNFQRILALFDTPLHGSVMKCFHFLYTYCTGSTLPMSHVLRISTLFDASIHGSVMKCSTPYTLTALLVHSLCDCQRIWTLIYTLQHGSVMKCSHF